MNLSSRARRLLASPPLPEYFREHAARQEAAFDPQTRPGGYIPFCVAENALVFDLLKPRMDRARDVARSWLGYQSMIGAPDFRASLAEFMSDAFLGRRVSGDQLAVLSGAGSVLELLFHALADEGEGVLVPTPSYAGFWADLETRDGLRIVPVHTSSADGFRLTRDRLERALAEAPCRIRALLFTTPNNPLGTVSSRAEIEEIVAFGREHSLHIVFDEIYALSVFGERPFTSVASVADLAGDIHIVWAFSKDFAMSGLRCGVLVSGNADLLCAMDGLAYWAAVSGDTQFMLRELVEDKAWAASYLSGMRARLRESRDAVASVLEAAEIPCLPSEAGFFFLCDLRAFLETPSAEAERALWWRLLDQANVNLTPGAACRIAEPGFMRLCFAGVSLEAAVEGARRLVRVLRN